MSKTLSSDKTVCSSVEIVLADKIGVTEQLVSRVYQ
jgi:hypothetical protein